MVLLSAKCVHFSRISCFLFLQARQESSYGGQESRCQEQLTYEEKGHNCNAMISLTRTWVCRQHGLQFYNLMQFAAAGVHPQQAVLRSCSLCIVGDSLVLYAHRYCSLGAASVAVFLGSSKLVCYWTFFSVVDCGGKGCLYDVASSGWELWLQCLHQFPNAVKTVLGMKYFRTWTFYAFLLKYK
jgi:hypothetical protein